jgi:hypothetical protein
MQPLVSRGYFFGLRLSRGVVRVDIVIEDLDEFRDNAIAFERGE